MWVARDKSGHLCLYLTDKEPNRSEVPYIFEWCGNHRYDEISDDLFSEIKWEDEPLEVDIVSIKELKSTQKELADVYHELIDYQTREIGNLTRVFRGVQLEEVANIINNIEESIHLKYKMNNNSYCEQNCRMVTIPHSSTQIGDNSLREYVVDDKVVATIYIRRNDFNNADILVSDLGGEYVDSKR